MALYVNGELVEQTLIDDEVQRLRPSYEHVFGKLAPAEREHQLEEWSRENVIEAVIFRQQARKEFSRIEDGAVQQALEQLLAGEHDAGPIHQRLEAGPAEEKKLRSEIADQIRRDRLMQKVTAGLPEPKDKDIRKYYDQNMDHFTMPEMVHAAHIVKHFGPETSPKEIQTEMEQILERLNSGASFEELASQHSDCPDSAGDLGFFARGKMVPGFEGVVFDLKPGEYSGVFRTEFGLHIAKVYEKRPAVPCRIDQVRDVIVRDLKQQTREKAVDNFLDVKKAEAVIEER
jgi:parvulin-like peptidyl-prolyl isomerase